MNTCTRTLRRKLIEEDIARLGTENAHLQIDIAHLEFERKKITAKIKPLDERSDEIAHIIVSGEEERDVVCEWHYDYKNRIKRLYATDTWEIVETDSIKEHEMQKPLFDGASQPIPALFTNCPACLYVKSGNPCAAALCGNFAMIHRSIPGPCEHPLESRVEESNVVTCSICKTVLDIAPITREMQAVEMECDHPETYETGAETVNVAEEAAFSRGQQSLPNIDKNRTCCYPHQRTIKMEGDLRIMYCTVCGLIAKKEDYSDVNNPRSVSFIVGERVDLSEGKAAA